MKKRNKVLIVIDMQHGFRFKRWPDKAIARRVKRAKKHGEKVIFIEYAGYGKTVPIIARNTNRFTTVKKYGDGISKKTIAKHIPDNSDVTICGVNTSACVQSSLASIINLSNVKTVSVKTNHVGNDVSPGTKSVRFVKGELMSSMRFYSNFKDLKAKLKVTK